MKNNANHVYCVNCAHCRLDDMAHTNCGFEDVCNCWDPEDSRSISDRPMYKAILKPDKVYNIQSYDLFGMDYFNEHAAKPSLLEIYRRFSKRIDDIPFAKGGDEHGRLHEKRVLMLSLLLADALDLSKADMEVLANVAAWHDTGRVTDNEEPTHGYASAIKYENSTYRPSNIVSFICEYHSLDDEKAYNEIEHTEKINKKRYRLLYDVFKDADALDRIRFGIQDIDNKYFRNDISKRFILIAKIIFEGLK